MQVIINSDKNIDLNANTIEQFQSDVSDALGRFDDWVTRIEVHLTDENSSSKSGTDDIRCLIEARPRNHQPVSIEVRGGSANQSISEGIQTMERRLGTMLDKIQTQRKKGSS